MYSLYLQRARPPLCLSEDTGSHSTALVSRSTKATQASLAGEGPMLQKLTSKPRASPRTTRSLGVRRRRSVVHTPSVALSTKYLKMRCTLWQLERAARNLIRPRQFFDQLGYQIDQCCSRQCDLMDLRFKMGTCGRRTSVELVGGELWRGQRRLADGLQRPSRQVRCAMRRNG
jgi:hypothetical protein